jgi:hypothetical protein
MKKLALLAVMLALAACGTAPPAPRATGSETATPFSTAPAPTPSGRFARVLGIMDCPGGCPSFSVSEALAQPGAEVDPILVDGFLFVHDDGSILLCEGLSDDVTPTCSGTRVSELCPDDPPDRSSDRSMPGSLARESPGAARCAPAR